METHNTSIKSNCKPFALCQQTTDEFATNSKEHPFSFEELQDEILKRGGVFRVDIGLTLNDYLEELVEKKIIYYGGQSQKYYFRYPRKIEDWEISLQKLKVESEIKELGRLKALQKAQRLET